MEEAEREPEVLYMDATGRNLNRRVGVNLVPALRANEAPLQKWSGMETKRRGMDSGQI